MDDIDYYLKDLESRFKKDMSGYYLSYSGGRDSHFLYWFIKEYLKRDDIEIVAVNTYMEHPQILKRMLKYSDKVLLPKMKPLEIKEKYGIPCFSKEQDQFIYYYQNSLRKGKVPARTTLEKVNRTYKTRSISKKASNYVLSGNAHMITHLCCFHLKKKPFKDYEKQTGKKAILGVRGGESDLRKRMYTSCYSANGKFHPLYDMSDDMLRRIEERFDIEVPSIYEHISRTGCTGCPYSSYKNECEKELALVNENKRNFIIEYFKESYDILKVDYKNIKKIK